MQIQKLVDVFDGMSSHLGCYSISAAKFSSDATFKLWAIDAAIIDCKAQERDRPKLLADVREPISKHRLD
jgi:hypothetical protein